jgi:hypothetical protein
MICCHARLLLGCDAPGCATCQILPYAVSGRAHANLPHLSTPRPFPVLRG